MGLGSTGFEVLPAIDVSGGRLAAYSRRGPEPVESFGGDPLAAARAFVDAGARWLHVVDLDLAFFGEARNLDVLRTVAALGPPVQASGGVRTVGEVQAMLDAGAGRVVLGSGALADERAAVEAIGRYADRLIVGLEVEDGRVRSRGARSVDLPLDETLQWLVAGDASGFLVTTVSRVGTLESPDVATVTRVVRSPRPVLAAGGISSIDDLQALRRAGAVGAVVGRAAIERGLDLVEALAFG